MDNLSTLEFLIGLVLFCLGAEETAHAYIDPGSGSMLLQLLIGGGSGLLVLGGLLFRRLARVVRRGPWRPRPPVKLTGAQPERSDGGK
jgi:hypothetical protein